MSIFSFLTQPIASVLGGVIGGFGNFLGAHQSNSANLQAVRETNEMNYKIAQENRGYNTVMWKMNNAYNTPAAQMERLRNAGLNPALVYGSGKVVGNTSGPAPRADLPTMQAFTNYKSPIGAVANSLVDVYNNYIAQKKLIADTHNVESNTTFLDEKARTERVNQDLAAIQYADRHFDLGLKKEARQSLLDEMNMRGQTAAARYFTIQDQGYYYNTQALGIASQMKVNDALRDKIAAETRVALANVAKINEETKVIRDTRGSIVRTKSAEATSAEQKAALDKAVFDYKVRLQKLGVDQAEIDKATTSFRMMAQPISYGLNTFLPWYSRP